MVKLTNIRFGIHTDEKTGNHETRIVMEFSGPVNYEIGQFTKPLRLYFDFAGTSLDLKSKEIEVKDNLVSKIRAGQFNSATTRVVLDLVKLASYQIFILPAEGKYPFRVVVDLDHGVKPVLQALKGKVIALDPGHGGEDPGAIGGKVTKEKDIVLDIAKRTQQLLTVQGAKVILTRAEDIFIALDDRATKANTQKAQIFVSIHSNAAKTKTPGGIETYYFPGSQAGKVLAGKVQDALIANLGLKNRGIKTARFYVLHHTKMTACLVEIGFLTNPQEESLLNQGATRKKAAEAIAGGIVNYFKK